MCLRDNIAIYLSIYVCIFMDMYCFYLFLIVGCCTRGLINLPGHSKVLNEHLFENFNIVQLF